MAEKMVLPSFEKDATVISCPLFGNANWQNYAIVSDVVLAGGDVEISVWYIDCNRDFYNIF